MFRKNKKKTSRFYKRREKRKKSSKLLEISIIFLTLLLLIYGFSLLKKISQSEATLSPSQNEDLIFVRTQVLNGCQGKDLAQRVADKLRGMRVTNITYDIIQIGNFEDSKPEQSFILDRTGDEEEANLNIQTPCPSEIALRTAQALGIDKENVLCKKLNNNYQEIALTIVIGKDYQKLLK